MHPNPAFRGHDTSLNIRFARDRAFGVLAVNAPDGPLMSHVPFLLREDGASADLHLVRSNPIARQGEATRAVISVSGPDGYVSPDWYGTEDQVPTWNYVAVHLRGLIRPLPIDDLSDLLDRQSSAYEERLLPKTPWTTGKMTPDAYTKMKRIILPFRLEIDSIDGTWKLNQNKADHARIMAADKMAANQIGFELSILTELMREPPAKE